MTNTQSIQILKNKKSAATDWQLADALDNAIAALERQEWISVVDDLPEDGQYVLVQIKGNQFPVVCQWVYKKWDFVDENGKPRPVIAWMNLPEPFDEKKLDDYMKRAKETYAETDAWKEFEKKKKRE